MPDIIFENGAFTFYYDGEAMSSDPTLKVAKAHERRFLKLINKRTLSLV